MSAYSEESTAGDIVTSEGKLCCSVCLRLLLVTHTQREGQAQYEQGVLFNQPTSPPGACPGKEETRLRRPTTNTLGEARGRVRTGGAAGWEGREGEKKVAAPPT
jgi:hypothetical protein